MTCGELCSLSIGYSFPRIWVPGVGFELRRGPMERRSEAADDVAHLVFAPRTQRRRSEVAQPHDRQGVGDHRLFVWRVDDTHHVVASLRPPNMLDLATEGPGEDRKSTRLNSSHSQSSYAV